MTKRIAFLLIIALLVLAGCGAKPDKVAAKLAEAMNAQDLDAALRLFADDAVVDTGGEAPFSGIEEIQGWLEGILADNFQIEIEILEVGEGRVVERDTIRMDSAREMGLTSLQGTSEITVEGGKITALHFGFSDESLEDLQLAAINAVEPTHADLPYRDDGDPAHTLDVYLPEGVEGPLPVLFAIHGGDGSKEDLHGWAGYFGQLGYAAVLPQADEAPDAFCSLAWVHANANAYGLDPERIVAFGYSLGGLLVTNLATVDELGLFLEGCPHTLPDAGRVQGVATYAAVLGTPEGCLTQSWCMLGASADNGIPLAEITGIFAELNALPPATWRESSELSENARQVAYGLPLYWLDGSEPPFQLIHGGKDEVVPATESEAFAARLQDAGVDVELLLWPGAAHNTPLLRICEALEGFASSLFGE